MMEPRTVPRRNDALDDAAQCEGVELALTMGQLLMDHGAESELVEQTVRQCGASLGCRWEAVLVTYNALVTTVLHGDGSRMVMRRVGPRAVDMSMVERVSHLSQQVIDGTLSPAGLKLALRQLEGAPRHYSPGLTILAVGLACAAFSRLFHGDWPAFGVTFAGTAGAMLVRHYYVKIKPNRLLYAAVSACVAGSIVGGLQSLFSLSQAPHAAYVACALMLVPGVPAINAVQDLIKGHLSVALARGLETAVITLAATLGLMLGLSFAQVPL